MINQQGPLPEYGRIFHYVPFLLLFLSFFMSSSSLLLFLRLSSLSPSFHSSLLHSVRPFAIMEFFFLSISFPSIVFTHLSSRLYFFLHSFISIFLPSFAPSMDSFSFLPTIPSSLIPPFMVPC